MPIEIKELHIRVTVNGAEGGANKSTQDQKQGGGGGSADKEAIIAECVEQVLQILQDKKER